MRPCLRTDGQSTQHTGNHHVWQVGGADVSTRLHIAFQMRTDAPVIAPAPSRSI